MGKVCFAVLAHHFRDCLEQLINNLNHFEPGCQIVLYNGGVNPQLFAGLEALVCPYSTPLKYRRPQKSTIDMMKWVTEQNLDYDYFVLIDHDMLLIRHGFSQFLDREMKDHEYMGLLKGENGLITPDLGWGPGRKFLRDWNRGWQALFSLPAPYGCFNPGQVFRKSYVDKFMNFQQLDRLLDQIYQSRLSSLGEIIFPTMAYVLDCNPKRFPFHDKAIRYRKPHSSDELKKFLQIGDIYLIHPVPMNINAPIRQFIQLLSQERYEEAMEMNWTRESIDDSIRKRFI